MAEALDASALTRWRRTPIEFIEEVLVDPETGRPFELFPAQREFFSRAWTLNEDGRLVFPEQIFAAIKKTGKTGTAGLHLITTTLIYGGRFAEGYCVANDLEQAQGRVFQAVRRICESSPHLQREVEVTQSRIIFPETGAVIQAIGSDYAGAAGANPTISSFDELWAYTSEKSRRLWDEMCASPARKISCRVVSTYAGFEGESQLLWELYQRGLKQPEVAPSLYAGSGLLMAWHHEPIAPWQSEAWLAEQRVSMRPNQYLRMIENRFVTSESSFIDMAAWDRCVDPNLSPVAADRGLSIWVGVDASVKHDSTAIVAVTFDQKAQQVRLVKHRVFQPTPDDPLDFEASIERTLLDLNRDFYLRQVLTDPFQMASVSQRLVRQGLPIEEFPQSMPNLTFASQGLYDAIMGGGIRLYPDAGMRLAANRAVAIESSRGWRIGKEKSAHKIDQIVALAMAAHAAVQGSAENAPLDYRAAYCGGETGLDDSVASWRQARTAAYLLSGGMVRWP